MDKLPRPAGLSYPEPEPQVDSLPIKELADQLVGIVRRQYSIIIVISACAIALSLVYLLTTPKLYTAHAMFLIDTTKLQVLRQQQDVVGAMPLDSAQVETEIQLLKSEGIGLSVVKALKLTEDPEFVGPQTSFTGAVLGLIFSPFSFGVSHGTMSEEARTASALGRFLSHRNITRVGETYVLDFSYTSLNPGRAAEVANGIADAYLTDKLQAKFESSGRARKWLEDRVGEMRLQAMTADSAVLDFKEKNGIVDTGSSKGTGDGQLLADQRVADLNTQLGRARAATGEAKARLDRVQTVLSQKIPDAAVADSLNSSIINQLRTQYLEYDRRYQVYVSRYGLTHLAVINLQTQMAELRRSMADELNRIAESYKSNYEIAKLAEENLEKNLAQQIAGAQLTNRDRLGLDELERKAKVYHAAHDGFLQQFMQITQQQSLPVTEARVISAATPPGGASSPNTSRILFMASALGLMVSFAAAYLWDTMDNVFRTQKQVQQILKVNCLTILPRLQKAILSISAPATEKAVLKSGGTPREINGNVVGPYRQVVDEPLSAFAEGVRAIKVATDITRSIKQNGVIGVTSSLPHEGKSVVATNFAELIANGGGRVILVDCDLRNPTLTRKLAPKADIGLLQVMSGECDLQLAIYTDVLTGLAFLPAVIESRLANSSEILASEALSNLLERLRKTYDYVIVDLPPLAPVVDVRATTNIIDSYVFVIEWGKTRIKMVQRQLDAAPEIAERLLGVVLNKANSKLLNRYEDYYGSYYYKKGYYAAYGYTR